MRSGKKRSFSEDVDKCSAKKKPSNGIVLKSADNVWLVGYPLERITTHFLPTRRQAYQYFHYLKQKDSDTVSATQKYRKEDERFKNMNYLDIIATKVVDEVAVFWEKGGYPIKPAQKCRQEVLKIHQEWTTLKKSKSDLNVGSAREAKRETFSKSLDSILNFNPVDWEKAVKMSRNPEAAEMDINFMDNLLRGIKTGGMIGGVDKIYSKTVESRMNRKSQEEKRRSNEEKRKSRDIAVELDMEESDGKDI